MTFRATYVLLLFMFAADTAVDPLPDAAAERVARQGLMLRELAELGMEIAREVRTQAVTPVDPDDPAPRPPRFPGDLGLVFSRVARAVRQTLALETRLAEEHQANAARAAAGAQDHAAHERIARHAERKGQISRIVEEAIENCAEASDVETLQDEWEERLDDGELDGDVFSQPIGVIVARICADLGVTPDWDLWADDDWARAEAAENAPGSPYAEPPDPYPDEDPPFAPPPSPHLLEHHPP